MSDMSSYQSGKRVATKQGTTTTPTIFGIVDFLIGGWYMVNGLVFWTLYEAVAIAQLGTMLTLSKEPNSLPTGTGPRFVIGIMGTDSATAKPLLAASVPTVVPVPPTSNAAA